MNIKQHEQMDDMSVESMHSCVLVPMFSIGSSCSKLILMLSRNVHNFGLQYWYCQSVSFSAMILLDE